jgi:hypothetical protein
MKHGNLMPGRKIQDVVRENQPQLLQRPWYFCGFVSGTSYEYRAPCRHGPSSPWVGLQILPDPSTTMFTTVDLKRCVQITSHYRRVPYRGRIEDIRDRYRREIFKTTGIWIGQCSVCEKVYWMMQRKGRMLAPDLSGTIRR